MFRFLRKLADLRTGDNRYANQRTTQSESSVQLAIKCMVQLTSDTDKKEKSSAVATKKPSTLMANKKSAANLSLDTASSSEISSKKTGFYVRVTIEIMGRPR